MATYEFTIDWLNKKRRSETRRCRSWLMDTPETLMARGWSWWLGSKCCCYPTKIHDDGTVTGDVRWESNGLPMAVVGTFSMRIVD